MFEPFLNVVYPDKPGNLDNAKKLVAAFPSAFPSDTLAAIHSEFEIFFEYFLRESPESAEKLNLLESQNSSENDISITKAASVTLRISRKHGKRLDQPN